MARRAPRTRYSTGNAALDEKIAELIREAQVEREAEAELIAGIVVTALLLAHDHAAHEDLKIINSAVKEMRYAFKIFSPYRHVRKVSVFGSARTRPGDPDYEQSRGFGTRIASEGWMVVTGAGPGSMEAANEGAGSAASFGVNIRLPFEVEPNQFIAEDPKLINFKYFFTRKLMFIKEADAFVLLPGGFGTMDEAFELLTLIQTGKSDLHPIVLLDPPAGEYWKGWLEFVRHDLLDRGYVSESDFKLFTITDDIEQATDEILRFYSNYHSMRYVGRRLILRLQRVPGDDALAQLSAEFSDILVRGVIERTEPSRGEIQDEDALELGRLALTFNRMHHGRLRELVDKLNEY